MSDSDRSFDAPVLRLGSYRLIAPLGSGGMSSVYRAVHEQTGHEVAIKVLPRYLAKNTVLLQRFLREAQNAETLQHPNIVAIYDRGQDGGRYYLVMEFVPGADLHDRVQQEGPLAEAEVVDVIRQVAHGLGYAAQSGLIHRDIKPANLLRTPDGEVKIIDLGLALHLETDDERVTRDGTTVGTVDYMAPEQARDSRAISARSDIYSLGCTAYYLLTGSAPFSGGDLPEKLRRHSKEAPPDVREARPEVSEGMSRLIRKMMAKQPERRFQGYDELTRALDALPPAAAPPRAREAEAVYALVDDDESDDDPGDFSTEKDAAEVASRLTSEIESPRAPRRDEADLGGLNLAALAELDEDEPAERPRPARNPVARFDPPGPEAEDDVAPDLEEDDPDDEPLALLPGATRGTAGEIPVKSWVIGGGLVGAAMLLVLFAIEGLRRPPLPPSQPEGTEVAEEDPPPAIVQPAVAPIVRPRPPVPTPEPRPPSVAPRPQVVEAQPPPAFVEPGDEDLPMAPEPPIPAPVEAKFPPVVTDIDAPPTPPIATVRRFDAANLTMETGKVEGTVEIASNGPFFPDDLAIGGKSRLIRAARGYRPILVLGAPRKDAAKKRPAVFVLENKRVTLEGLDLIVEVGRLPATQAALFLCRGVDLTLRDCTITVIGPGELPFVVVRVEGMADATHRSRIRLERTYIRGRAVTAVDLVDAGADVDIARSVLACGSAPVIAATRSSQAAGALVRSLRLDRSLCLSRGAFLDVADDSPSSGGASLHVRALGTTFARVGVSTASGLVHARKDPRGRPQEVADWRGDYNNYIGWPRWLTGPGEGSVSVASLADA
ncbi:MAG TPA: protein kinase, partial [Isosphaeraceae bacterium]